MTTALPQVIHTYQNHTLDSTRWQRYQPRSGDIVIATSYKSGTNWMQEIVRQLIFQGQDVPEREDDCRRGRFEAGVGQPGCDHCRQGAPPCQRRDSAVPGRGCGVAAPLIGVQDTVPVIDHIGVDSECA